MTTNEQILKKRNEILERAKSILVSSLNLELSADQIHPDEVLFGVGLGLDSIDSLQLTVAVKSEFGVEIQDKDRWALRSLNTIVDYIMLEKGLIKSSTDNRVTNYVANDKDESFTFYNQIRNEMVLRINQKYCILKIIDEELALLNKIVTKDIEFVQEGSITMTIVLNNDGKFISEVYFMNNFDHHFILLPSERSEELLKIFSSAGVNYEDITSSACLILIDGYKANGVIEDSFGPTASSLKPGTFSIENLDGIENLLVGRLDEYGEFGFFIMGRAEDRKNILTHFEGVRVLDEMPKFVEQLLWLEACRFHAPVCFSEKQENIIEAGLAALVSFDKDTFCGNAAIESIRPEKKLVHFRSETEVTAGENLTFDGEDIGYIVACQYSPLLNQYVGNAYVLVNFATSGMNYQAATKDISVNLISAPQIVGQSYLTTM